MFQFLKKKEEVPQQTALQPQTPAIIWNGDLSDFEALVTLVLESGDEGRLLSLAKGLALEKQKSNLGYLEKMKVMRTLIKKNKVDEQHKETLKTLFMAHSISEFSSDQYADIYQMKFPAMQASSLRMSYVRRRRMRQIGRVPERWLTYNKRIGEEFAERCGVRIPETQYDLAFHEIPHKTNMVIKPNNGSGSKCVYIIKEPDEIWSVERLKSLHRWEEMEEEIRISLEKKRIPADKFEIQQCIYGNKKEKAPAHDLKFYSFYGEIGAVLEIARYPEKAYWWWTADGRPINFGKAMPEHMQPQGATAEEMEVARKLSAKLPIPFMRLDFLKAEDGLYFDEFCAMSGGQGATVLEQYGDTYDHIFGTLYLKAEMRLINDLLDGKAFPEITEFNRDCDERFGKK